MKTITYVAVLLAVILFLDGTALTTNADTNIATRLTLDPIFSEAAPGDKVVFSGTLRTATGEGLFNMPIRIVEERSPDSIVLTTGWTNKDGVYEASWIAQRLNPSGNDRTMTIFATFDGHDKYYESKSATPVRLEINPKLMKVGLDLDSNEYFAGQNAKFKIVFFDRLDLIDPHNITAIYDGITVNVTKQRRGIYEYTTPVLEPKIHIFRIIAEKEGYEPVDRSVLFRTVGVYDDRNAPTSSAVIEGLYNNKTNWYYGRFPVATINATDHDYGGIASGVRHIVVQYWDIPGNPCIRNVCYLQPGENVTLSHYNEVDVGRIDVKWFAQDNMGNTERLQELSVYVDTLAPRLSVLSISTENEENIFTGKNCDKYRPEERNLQCVIVRALPNETITFRILAQDLISGVKSVYYRVGSYSAALNTDWQILETESMSFPHEISFKIPQVGAYRLEIKVEDIAGNESSVEDFEIFIS